jgi:hypothetical protein
MRRFVLVPAVLLLISGAAMADNFTWSYSGSQFSATGTVQATPNGDGTFTAISGTGTLAYGTNTYTLDFLIPNPDAPGYDTIHGYPDTGGADLIWDNQLVPVSSGLFKADDDGLAFDVLGTGSAFNPWDGQAALFGGGGVQVDNGTFQADEAPVPEPSGVCLLISVLAGTLLLKKKLA